MKPVVEEETAVDVRTVSRADLQKLRVSVEKAVHAVEQREREEALRAAQEAAAKMGFSLDEIGAEKPQGAKYRNPNDPSQTWSGRGAQPKWFTQLIEEGAKAADLER
nr:H-NS histone family protein [uncultured Ruegeria sp.]